MIKIIISILSIYIFILLGFVAKKSFKEKIDDKTITLINVYFLQAFLTFWGLMVRPFDFSLFDASLVYFYIAGASLFISAFLARYFFKDKKEYSIATVAAIIGNTGNLGIPINIAIFGEASIPYTTIINLVNVFMVYTVGVFYYSRGNFDTKTSFKNIFKLPILWAALAALILGYFGYKPDKTILNTLMMGAYTSMVMQLILFGIYLYNSNIKQTNKLLISWTLSFKFIILPLAAFIILSFLDIDTMIKGIIFIELIMPLAVANVNFASLYDCKPEVVASLVFISSFLFLAIIFVAVKILEFL